MPDTQTATTPPVDLAAQVDAAAIAAGQIPTEVKTATGQVFRGSTPQELMDQMRGSIESGTTTIKQLNDQNAALEAELARMRSDQNTGAARVTQTPTTPDPKTEYYTQFTQDPIKATEYALNQIPAFQQVMQAVEQVQQRTAADQFVQEVPEFPRNQQAADLMEKGLTHFNLEATVPNMVYVYNKLVHAGMIQPQNVPIVANTVQPAPMLGGTGGGTAAPSAGFDMVKFANLPADQMRKIIDQASASGLK